MSTVKYVCLSDLHLGADYSLLTWNSDGTADFLEPSSTLSALGRALRQYARELSGAELPTLVLMGDVLDLGQSPFGAAAQGFRRFLEAMFPAGEAPAFSTQVLTIPGNHDHHLWRTAQDQEFLARLSGLRDAGDDLIQSTPLFEPETGWLSCELMTRLMRGYPHLRDASVGLAYPNLGLIDEARSRCVVLHHGHFVDAIYRVMSTINGQFRGIDPRPATVDLVEQQNGAWIDFLFSDLGSAGEISTDVDTLYAILQDDAATHQFSRTLSDKVLNLLSKSLGIGADTQLVSGQTLGNTLGLGHSQHSTYSLTVANVVKSALDITLVRGAETERDSCFNVLSVPGISDLRWYLGGPVRRQLDGAKKLGVVKDLRFVFGHTHRPFQDQLVVEGFSHPVAVYNTGGWVMDHPTMAPMQGAAAVMIDDALNVASLRLYNDPLNGQCKDVHAAGVGGFLDKDNALLERMNEQLQLPGTAGLWKAFSDEAKVAADLHAESLLKQFFAGAR